jgi:hypothetical protein
MNFVGFNKKIKAIFYVFLLFLVLGIISLKIADSISYKYSIVRENLLNQIINKDLTENDIKKIENSLQTINEKFYTAETIAMFDKKPGINFTEYFKADFKAAKYLFPMNAVKKGNILNDGFRVTEGFDGGNLYIVHHYFPDWYYIFPVALFILSGVLLMLWLLFQIKYVYNSRQFRVKLT